MIGKEKRAKRSYIPVKSCQVINKKIKNLSTFVRWGEAVEAVGNHVALKEVFSRHISIFECLLLKL